MISLRRRPVHGLLFFTFLVLCILIQREIFWPYEDSKMQYTWYNSILRPKIKTVETGGNFEKEEAETKSDNKGDKERHNDDIKKAENITSVMILTKMRSGSTLAGDILQQDAHAFYIYEPLVAFHYSLTERKYSHLLLNGQRKYIDENGYYNHSRTIIKGYFTCNFQEIDVATLSHNFISFGIRGRKYIKCLDKSTNMSEDELIGRVTSCISILQKECLTSRQRIVKIVRLPMAFAGSLLGFLPNLNILHLIRDPRAIQNSKAKAGAKIYADLQKDSMDLCTKLQDDMTSTQYFMNIFPNRIIILKYEDLASDPIGVSKDLYAKYGFTFTDSIYQYIVSITMANKEDGCIICPQRKNSTQHVVAWRKELSKETIGVITKECNNYLRYLQYI